MRKFTSCIILTVVIALLSACAGNPSESAPGTTASDTLASTEVSVTSELTDTSSQSEAETDAHDQTSAPESTTVPDTLTEESASITEGTAVPTEMTTVPSETPASLTTAGTTVTTVTAATTEKTNAATTTAAKTTTAATTRKPVETTTFEIPETAVPPTYYEYTSPVINETTVTYETLGADKEAKQKFEKKIDKETDLPVINVTTNGEKVTSLETYVSCVVDVFSCDKSMEIDEASAGIKVRGNSSAFYGDVNQILHNQVPYRIKFDEKRSMLGLNDGAECKSWVLLKSDWDLIRNDIAFRFGRAIMSGNSYCTDSQFVHLYINDEFKGVYVLCEQNQVNKHRVNISEPVEGYTGTDIGYFLELDHDALRELNNFFVNVDYCAAEVTDIDGTTRRFVPAEYSIKSDLYSQEQIDFIDKYLNNVFKIVYEACENEKYYAFDENYDLVASSYTNAKDTINAVVDMRSIVDMYILYEIVHDYDCGEGSFFMCVDFSAESKCPKLQFTSPWDFNWAYDGGVNRYYAAAFNAASFVRDKGDRSNPWFILLMKQDWFVELVKDKWTEMYNDGTLRGCIKEETAILEKYDKDLNKSADYATACAFDLFKWINKRLDWLDMQFVK